MSEPTSDPSTTSSAEAPKAPKKTSDLSFKVSEKGAVSVYGLGRFPVTLYQEQWKRLLGVSPGILEFIQANADKLKVKE